MVGRHSKGGLDTQAGRTVVEAVAKYQPKDGCRAGDDVVLGYVTKPTAPHQLA